MDLPNYFLADLPPEATLSPAMITAACETLKRNREKYLAPRKMEELVQILCEVAASWLEPGNKFRRRALASCRSAGLQARLDESGQPRAVPEAGAPLAGFSAATMARGLDDFFRRFTPENFEALLAQDLGKATIATDRVAVPRQFWHGPQLLVHVAAGNIPNPALMSLTRGLL